MDSGALYNASKKNTPAAMTESANEEAALNTPMGSVSSGCFLITSNALFLPCSYRADVLSYLVIACRNKRTEVLYHPPP